MRCEVIAIGTELLLGQIVDTNSSWIGEQLALIGIDSHFRDPITHLALTVQGFRDVVKELSKVSAKWMGLGGGGYDLQAVARGWASAYGVMCEYELQEQIPLSYGGVHEVYTLSDDDSFTFGYEIHEKARKFAEGSVAEIRKHIFPFHGLGHLE